MTSTPRKLLHVAALTAAVAALAGCPEKPPAPKAASVAAAPLPGPAPATLAQLPDFTHLVHRVGPAVVNVTATRRGGAAPQVERGPLPDYFEVSRSRRALSEPITVDELPRDAA